MSLNTLVPMESTLAHAPHRFEYLFTPLTEAIHELKRRQADAALAERIHAALGSETAELLERMQRPTALLFRQLATPSHEVLEFLEITTEYSLHPLILEYSGDKFVGAGNPHKRALGKMPIYQYTGSDGRDMVQYRTVIDFNAFMGKPLADVCCISGRTLREFHHYLLEEACGIDTESACYDASEWFQARGGAAANYYESFMTLLIRDCILFENYHATPQEEPLVNNIVIPAFESVQRRYGLRPLITRLIPAHEELRTYWDMYPKRIAELLN